MRTLVAAVDAMRLRRLGLLGSRNELEADVAEIDGARAEFRCCTLEGVC